MKIFASVGAADPLRLGDALLRLEAAGVDGLHIDLADGRFTPVLQGGLEVVKAVRAATRLPIAVHLMVADPEAWMGAAVVAGAGRVSVHLEAAPYPWRLRALGRRLGIEFGLALNPGTSLVVLDAVKELPDFVSLLTTEPDDAGERFLPGMTARVEGARRTLPGAVEIEIDGGVTAEICAAVLARGAGTVVAGRALFNTSDWSKAIGEFRASLRGVA